MLKTIPDILAQIVEEKKRELSRRAEGLDRAAEESIRERRDFAAAISKPHPAIIAEIKKASPSKGVLAEKFDPVCLAQAYEAGGAAALSVLTDQKHFQGKLEDLESARGAVGLPVLRKDFTIDPYHVVEAAAHQADAILLIAAILSERELRDFRELGERYRLASLVEVHDREELQRAAASGARMIGVNNRNLRTFDVDLGTALTLAESIPAGVLKVAESGIHCANDIQRLRAAGYDAFLVGEHLMTTGHPVEALRALLA
jgi:indole-3-glycerol phosphate synthase